MKHVRLFVLLAAVLLLSAALIFTSCDKKPAGNDTTAADTTADTPTEAPTDTPTDAPETTPDTEAETTPPADLTAEEAKALLASALAQELTAPSVTVKGYMNGEEYSSMVVSENGKDFLYENSSMGVTERVVAVGDTVYYAASVSDGISTTQLRHSFTATEEQRTELYSRFIADANAIGLDDGEMTQGLLEGTLIAKRHSDGRVEMTCSELDDSFVELLMGEPMAGATVYFEFSFDAAGRMTFMRFTVMIPAELAGGSEMTVSSESVIDYESAAIKAPEDAAEYAPTTYDDLFGFALPELNPEEAAALGLPVDGNNYTIGGEGAAVSAEEQFYFLCLFAPYYEGKTFTVYGNVMEDENGNLAVSVGEDLNFVAYFDGVKTPVPGSYVKLTATFTRTVDLGDYVDFDCFTMMATACETLGEAVGPNGGKLMFITASSLNVRTSSDTSTSDNILGQLSHGDMVEVFEQDAKGWYRIEFNGQKAYISNKYVSETKP